MKEIQNNKAEPAPFVTDHRKRPDGEDAKPKRIRYKPNSRQ
ncbi:MAG: hypothetical protein WBM09_11985 [Gallionella sp.]